MRRRYQAAMILLVAAAGAALILAAVALGSRPTDTQVPGPTNLRAALVAMPLGRQSHGPNADAIMSMPPRSRATESPVLLVSGQEGADQSVASAPPDAGITVTHSWI